jgi:hypothetical protein
VPSTVTFAEEDEETLSSEVLSDSEDDSDVLSDVLAVLLQAASESAIHADSAAAVNFLNTLFIFIDPFISVLMLLFNETAEFSLQSKY